MPNINLSPNMNLPIPVVGVDPGPDYANNIDSCLTILDQHSHLAGSGVQIVPAAININSPLTFNNNSAINLAALTLTPQLSPPSSNGSIYESGVDLYYLDGNGNNIRITQSGSVAGSSGTITGLPSGTASASYAGGTFTFQAATATGANIDAASYVFRNNTANSFGVTVSPPNALGSDYSLVLPSIPGQTSFLGIDTSGNISAVTSFSGGITGGNIASATITGSNIALSTINGANIVPGTIAGSNIGSGTITGGNIASATITGSNIALSTIAGANIGPGTIESVNIDNGAILPVNIQTNINLNGKAVKEQGANVVVSNANATNSLSIIRGAFAANGAISAGEGFSSARTGVGTYNVNFNTSFADVPAVTCTVFDISALGNPYTATLEAISPNGFTVIVQNSSTTAASDQYVLFIVVGQRN